MNAGRIVCGVLLAWLLLAAACGQSTRAGEEGNIMKPSTTYLYLLRKTPFFTSLDTQQLRWTIDHSREWEAQPGAVIAECGEADDFWILLDGRWQVERDGRSFAAGHADAGKWFSASEGDGACRLVTTEHSYVTKITRADMDHMLARGFAFGSHLQQGRAYYATLFATTGADQ